MTKFRFDRNFPADILVNYFQMKICMVFSDEKSLLEIFYEPLTTHQLACNQSKAASQVS